MNAPRFRIDEIRQRVGISRFEFCQPAPVQHGGGQRVAALGQPFQHIGTGAPGAGFGFLAARQTHFVKENIAKLLGAGNVEFFTGQRIYLILHGRHFLGKFTRQARQHRPVNQHTLALHIRDHLHQRPLGAFINTRHTLRRQPRLQTQPQAQRDIGIFGRISGRLIDRHAVEGNLVFARPQQFLDRDWRMVQKPLRQFIHSMTVRSGSQRIGNQHGVINRRNRHAAATQHLQVKFGVLQNFQNGRIRQHGCQQGECRLLVQLFGRFGTQIQPVTGPVCQWHIARLARCHGQRNADQTTLHGIQPIGFSIHRDNTATRGARHPVLQFIGFCHACIGRHIQRRHFGRWAGAGALPVGLRRPRLRVSGIFFGTARLGRQRF